MTNLLLGVLSAVALSCQAFAPSSKTSSTFSSFVTTRRRLSEHPSYLLATIDTEARPLVDERTGKRTGISFLPEETIKLAEAGSPIEKIKLAKDGTSAFVDVYEYARKIREGEMTWEEVEAADLDSVRNCTICPIN